jgi:hypothetical protein
MQSVGEVSAYRSRAVSGAETYSEDLERDLGRHTPERRELLGGGHVVAINIAVLERSLPFRVHKGGRRGGVQLRVLARRVARRVNQGRVQADSLLRGRLVISQSAVVVILTTSAASPTGMVGEEAGDSGGAW